MQTNEVVIEHFANRKSLKALALFHLLKKRVSHSVIYNFSYKQIGEIAGISDKTAKKYIGLLLEYRIESCNKIIYGGKIAEIKNGHLYLYSVAPVKHLCTIKFSTYSTIDDVEALLYGKLIHSFQLSQSYNINKKREDKRILEHPKKGDHNRRRDIVRTAMGILRVNAVTPEGYVGVTDDQLLSALGGPYNIKMGSVNISNRLNVSRHKLLSVVKSLEKSKVLTTKKNISSVQNCSLPYYRANVDLFRESYGHCWWFKGKVWNNKTKEYSFLNYPVKDTVPLSLNRGTISRTKKVLCNFSEEDVPF